MKKFTFIITSLFLFNFLISQDFKISGHDILEIFNENLYNEIKTDNIKNNTKGPYCFDNTIFSEWHEDYIVVEGGSVLLDMGIMPVGWSMVSGNKDTQQSTDSHVGSYAMRIENGYVTIEQLGYHNELIRGYAIANQRYLETGLPAFQKQWGAYTQRPFSMSFYMKGNLLNNDHAIVAFSLGRLVGGNFTVFAMARADISPTAINPDSYRKFTVPFYYVPGEDDPPTHASLLVFSSGVGIPGWEDVGTLTDGSYIIIDDIRYQMSDLSSIENKATTEIAVYPNPASNVLTITNANNSEIKILNILGKVVATVKNPSKNQNINISHLPSGTYFVRVDSKVFKINVVK